MTIKENKEKRLSTIAIVTSLYNELEEMRYEHRVKTTKDFCEEIIALGMAVKRGEYVKANAEEVAA